MVTKATQEAAGGGFPAWLSATAIVALGVWAAESANPSAGRWLAGLILLGVLIVRPGGVDQLLKLMHAVLGR